MSDDRRPAADPSSPGTEAEFPAEAPNRATDDAGRSEDVSAAVNATAAAGSLNSAGSEPSLVANEARSGVEGLAGASDTNASDRGRQPPGLSGGRVDARGAAEGAASGSHGAAAAGGPVTSVGTPEGDRPGQGPDDFASRGDQAGVLEDVAGREGANSGGGEQYDDMGELRSIGRVAADSADSGTPNEGPGRALDDESAGEAAAGRHGTGETDWGTHGLGGDDDIG